MSRGRPRQFDKNEALDHMMMVFWTKGYEGTSTEDLCKAVGVNKPSLYAAFGNKESMFLQVLDHYRQAPASYVNRALKMPTAREVFRELMHGVVDLTTDPKLPGGCLLINGALARGSGSGMPQKELTKRRIGGEQEIKERFEQAVANGDLPPDADTGSLAKLAATFIWGISVQAVNGCSNSELKKLAALAISAFDEITRQK